MARLSSEVQTILAQADGVARASGRPTGSVHLLVAFCFVECQARDLLAEAGVDDKRVLDTFESMSERDEPADVLRAIHQQAGTLTASVNSAEVTATLLLASVLRVREALAWRVLEAAGVDSTRLRARVIGQATLHRDRAATGTFKAAKLPDDGGGPRPLDTNRIQDPTRPTRPLPQPSPPQPSLPLSPLPQRPTAPVRAVPPRVPPGVPLAAVPTPPATTPAPAPADVPATASPTPPARGTRALDPRQFPTLCELGRNLSQAALDGEIDPIIGRDELIDAVIDVLLMKQVNNPCLVGEAGVGKTAVVEALALRLAQDPARYGKLGESVLVEVQVGSLLAGTALRGAFSERMKKLRDEVERAAGRVIVFIDEIHTLMGAGTGDGPLDAANDLKSALSRGKFPLIGATTRAEYDRHIAKDPAMERRFQVVAVPEPSVSEAVTILAGVAPTYTAHHGVRFSPEALQSAVHLSKRFITDQCLPHKAIAVIDRAASQARRAGKTVVQVDDVARAVHVLTQVPMERLLADERGRIRDLAAELCARVLGHDAAMERVAKRVQRNYAGFSGDRPVASFLFVGAPGSGKTEAARALAEVLFSRDDALVRFDMTEYAEPHTVARLIGSPPGYVGHGQPGLLGQALTKRPYRVLLFDEIDRAAPEVLALLLQLLDAGRVTDAQGVTIDARNCIVVLTSNLGAEILAKGAGRRTIGFGAPVDGPSASTAADQAVLERAKAALPAEFWGRIDDVLVFRPLDLAAARAIVQRTLLASAARLFEARLVRYQADDAVVDLVLADGLDPASGVRPLRARVESLVEGFVAERVLDGSLQPGSEAILTVTDGALALRPAS